LESCISLLIFLYLHNKTVYQFPDEAAHVYISSIKTSDQRHPKVLKTSLANANTQRNQYLSHHHHLINFFLGCVCGLVKGRTLLLLLARTRAAILLKKERERREKTPFKTTARANSPFCHTLRTSHTHTHRYREKGRLLKTS